MPNEKSKSVKNIFPVFTLILSVNFLAVMICTCILFGLKLKSVTPSTPEIITLKEYIYIKDQPDEDASVSTGKDDINEESFLVKEYEGQIGIFSLEGGEIRYVIDRYIKTLPEADKRLLREGFVVIGIHGIYSVIEDYTG